VLFDLFELLGINNRCINDVVSSHSENLVCGLDIQLEFSLEDLTHNLILNERGFRHLSRIGLKRHLFRLLKNKQGLSQFFFDQRLSILNANLVFVCLEESIELIQVLDLVKLNLEMAWEGISLLLLDL